MTGDIPDLLTGLTEEEASDYVVDWLRQEGLLEKARELPSLGSATASEAGTRIQPLASLQWWGGHGGRWRPRRSTAIESGRVTFHPPVQNRVALDWLKNIRPWNVSRQLWWGPSAADLVLPRRARDVRRVGARRVRGMRLARESCATKTCSTRGFSSALWAVRDARLARRHARVAPATTRAT